MNEKTFDAFMNSESWEKQLSILENLESENSKRNINPRPLCMEELCMKNINIRKAEIKDVETIARIIVKAWKVAYKGIVSDDLLSDIRYKKYVPFIEKDIRDKDKIVFVYEEGEKGIVGFVSGGTPKSSMKNFDSELYAVYVLPEKHKRGIGKALFKRFVQWAKENSFTSFFLGVLKDNQGARLFYEKLGGKVVGSGKKIIGKELDLVFYGWKNI